MFARSWICTVENDMYFVSVMTITNVVMKGFKGITKL